MALNHIKDSLDGTIRPMTNEDLGSVLGSNGVEAGVTQYGYLRVTQEPNAWFTEPFDTLDTTNRWSTKLSTGTAAVTNGVLTISSSTTANAYGGLFTQPTFTPNGINFLAFGLTQAIPNVVQANTLRFWGWGSVQTTPTTSAPIVNGAGFELSAAGVLTAVVYQNGTKVQNVSTNVTLTNNVPFYSGIARRADRIDFYVNGTISPVATILIPTLFVATLPFQAIAINSTAPAAAAQMQIYAFGIADTGNNAHSIMDPTNPFWRARVTAGGATVSKPYSIPENDWVYAAASAGILNTTVAVTIKTAGGAGQRNYITSLQVMAEALGTATELAIRDGAAGTVIWRTKIPTGGLPTTTFNFATPLKGTANTLLEVVTLTASTTGAVYVNAQGYVAP
ncbi:MAG: hypothetical protein ING20_11615 [Burkholderiales bacterium]|nr:hypothetical protein [Burkholderiales bacterium]